MLECVREGERDAAEPAEIEEEEEEDDDDDVRGVCCVLCISSLSLSGVSGWCRGMPVLLSTNAFCRLRCSAVFRGVCCVLFDVYSCV